MIILRGKKEMSVEKMKQMIIELKIASEETIKVVTKLYGLKEQTLNDIVWAVTGHNTLQDYCEWEGIELPEEE